MVHEHRSLFLHQLTEIPALKSAPNYLAIVAVFIVAPAWAQAPSEDVDSNQDFELAGAGVAGLDGDGGLEMSDVSFVGTPLKDWFKNWPEDLVIAPIPGRSPQMGWKLTLAGGYFLESRDEDSDASPSVLGGFAMIAENGSYAYGAGANLRLLDDKLRVKIGGRRGHSTLPAGCGGCGINSIWVLVTCRAKLKPDFGSRRRIRYFSIHP